MEQQRTKKRTRSGGTSQWRSVDSPEKMRRPKHSAEHETARGQMNVVLNDFFMTRHIGIGSLI